MNTTTKMILAFALGAIAGYFAKNYIKRPKPVEEEDYEEALEKYQGAEIETADISTDKFAEGYTNYSNIKNEAPVKAEETKNSGIHVISPDDLYQEEEYDMVYYTYYDDGVLADENDMEVKDPENVVGDALKHIGEYEPDVIHVRNDNINMYYEISRDMRCYREVVRGPIPPDGR